MSCSVQNVSSITKAFDPAALDAELWDNFVAARSNISELSIMTHTSFTVAIKRLSKQKPIIDYWAMITQQTCQMGYDHACLTA